MKLIIVANRLPVKIVEEEQEYRFASSEGGLATGLGSLENDMEKHWVGWPGISLEEGPQRERLKARMEEQMLHPVHLTPEQIENFYEGYSNSTLWPLCHYFYNYIHHEEKFREAYREVNLRYCEAVAAILEPDDIVWVQDYQLMLVPGMIRERFPDVCMGYFLHIPFPSYELFRILPERADILRGILGADLVGFHTHDYMRHFISAAYRVLGLECRLNEIQLPERVVQVDAFPMGINYTKFNRAILDRAVSRRAKELRASFGNAKLMLSVDRLDYSKGLLTRLKDFEAFLEDHSEYRGKVSLVMIVSPSRDNVEQYAELKTEIDTRVGAINGRFSTLDWSPVYYFYQSHPFEELIALYHIADIAFIAPLRDGMNLVAKEYLAAKRNTPGVLILSEMAGAARELTDALIVNPTDVNAVKQAILQALKMPRKEQMERLRAMQEVISYQTVEQWAGDFMAELSRICNRNRDYRERMIGPESLAALRQEYGKARTRLILLDYDGTLVPFHGQPGRARPSARLKRLLERLGSDPCNRIVIISGRDSRTLDNWLGDLPVELAAEHGAAYKETGVWHDKIGEIVWDPEIVDIFRQITRITPGSRIETKKTALVWHYREVDGWLADMRLHQLIGALIGPIARCNLQVMQGNRVVEVKPFEANKGEEVKRLLTAGKYDFILAIGDDTTDEDMFQALPPEAVTIKVGKRSESTRYHIPTQDQVLPLLESVTAAGRNRKSK